MYEADEKMVYTLKEFSNEFSITKDGNVFEVKGNSVEKVIRRINIDDNESMHYMHKCLVNLGVEKALKDNGIQDGDIVKILDYEFEWYN